MNLVNTPQEQNMKEQKIKEWSDQQEGFIKTDTYGDAAKDRFTIPRFSIFL